MLLLPLIYTLLLPLGVALAEDIPAEEVRNHAAAFAANVTSSPDKVHALRNGNFVLVNQCYYDVYVWEAWDRHQSSAWKLKARSALRKEFITSYDVPNKPRCTDNCGVVYKVAKTPRPVGGNGGNLVQLEYSTKRGIIYYDISFVDCAKNLRWRRGDANNCPAWDQGLSINGQDKFGCKTMTCRPKEMCIANQEGAYFIDEPNPKWGLEDLIGTCPTVAMELYFRLCDSNPDL